MSDDNKPRNNCTCQCEHCGKTEPSGAQVSPPAQPSVCQCERCGKAAPSNWELYKLAIETRKFEIELFWKRSNYFLVLNTAIAVAFFGMENDKSNALALFICGFGYVVSYLWICMNLGSRFWQVRWEQAVNEFENEFCKNIKLFSVRIGEASEKVEKNFNRESGNNLYNYAVLKKPSVNRIMVLLAILFMFGWAGLFGYKWCMIQCCHDCCHLAILWGGLLGGFIGIALFFIIRPILIWLWKRIVILGCYI